VVLAVIGGSLLCGGGNTIPWIILATGMIYEDFMIADKVTTDAK
jgi:hypothetical protein